MPARTVGDRPTPVELTADRRITRRVKRLTVVSAIALGLIWGLAVETVDAPPLADAALAGGWLLMPTVLVASLAWPRLRYGLILPSGLVTGALLAIDLGSLPADPVAALGWLSVTAGVLLGGLMGLWFWFRVAPVPGALDDPAAPARWSLIALHVALIVLGLVLAALPLVAV